MTPPKSTLQRLSPVSVTDTCASAESLSISWSRRSIRSFGCWPRKTASPIALLSPASSARHAADVAVRAGDRVVLVLRLLRDRRELRREIALNEVASVCAVVTSAARAPAFSGAFATSLQAFQNLDELRREAVVGRLGERQLDLVERVRARGRVAEVHLLRAVLEVEELVADAADRGDVDAGAELRAGAGVDAVAPASRSGCVGVEHRLLARVAGACSRSRCCGR